MRVPLARPEISDDDIADVVAVLRSPHLSQGPLLREFEHALASYLHVNDVVAVNSGTSALQLALRVLNIGDGDEVILPSFSFMAVTNAIVSERAVPVFADIDPSTCNLDPAKLEAVCSENTRAIVIVNCFGFPAASAEIVSFAKRHSLAVIDDACEALGTEVENRKAGTFGDIGILAFYPNKVITTGEGGALVTNSSSLSARLRSLRNQGRQAGGWYSHAEPGFSFRLSDIHCALGLGQLRRIEGILHRREELAESYALRLGELPDVCCFRFHPAARISWFTYPVLLSKRFSREDRDWIWQELARRDIECGRYFAPSHLQPALSGVPFKCGDLENTVSLAGRVLCLPLFQSLTEDQIEFVCDSLKEILSGRSSKASDYVEAS